MRMRERQRADIQRDPAARSRYWRIQPSVGCSRRSCCQLGGEQSVSHVHVVVPGIGRGGSSSRVHCPRIGVVGRGWKGRTLCLSTSSCRGIWGKDENGVVTPLRVTGPGIPGKTTASKTSADADLETTYRTFTKVFPPLSFVTQTRCPTVG
jgi:hypothetical protein